MMVIRCGFRWGLRTGIVVVVSDVALYYPYVNFPADAWMKAAALHWPQVGRIHPSGYSHLRDSETIRRLKDELDFVVEVRPDRWGPEGTWVGKETLARVDNMRIGRRWRSIDDEVEALFFDFLDRYKDELIPRYGADALGVRSLHTHEVFDELLPLDPRLEEIHAGKLSYELVHRLAHEGLLISRSYEWRRAEDRKVLHMSDLAMHKSLASVYLAVLADVVARENKMTPLTDQPLTCAATAGWTVDAMARILLGDEAEAEEGDYSQVFAVMALQTVLPLGLADIPVERIIEARRRLLPQLMRYREFLDSLTPDLVDISAVQDPQVRAAKLRNHVESKITQPIEAMERELGRLGMQPIRAVLSLQTLAPPAALGVLATTVGLPSIITNAGVVAASLIGATHSALDQRRQARAGQPTGYLLDLRHELTPSDTVAHIRSTIRRARPGRHHR